MLFHVRGACWWLLLLLKFEEVEEVLDALVAKLAADTEAAMAAIAALINDGFENKAPVSAAKLVPPPVELPLPLPLLGKSEAVRAAKAACCLSRSELRGGAFTKLLGEKLDLYVLKN